MASKEGLLLMEGQWKIWEKLDDFEQTYYHRPFIEGWPLFDPSAALLLWTTFGTILIRTLFCCYISYICALSSMTLFIGPTCSELYAIL